MSQKLLLVVAWFPITLILLIVNLAVLHGYNHTYPAEVKLSAMPPQELNFQLAAGIGTSQVLSAQIIASDARAYLVESFLKHHDSPMAPFSQIIVNEADKNGIDFRLVTAIAMCESNAGKRMPKKDEFNAFGIAVYTGQLNGKSFDSWPHAIEWVSNYIKTRYFDRGITDLHDIGAIWAPPSVETGYSWTNCVESFKKEII